MKLRLTNQTFEQEVLYYDGIAVVDFYAVWCGKCSDMEPLLKEAAKRYEDYVKFASVDIEESALLAANYEIEVVPTYLLFKNGEMICRASGILQEEEMKKFIQMGGI